MTREQPLNAAAVRGRLETRWVGRTWRWRSRTTSTNDDARALAERGAAHGTVVLAGQQSRGRGRGGHSWHSPSGGLWMSVVLRPKQAPGALGALALAAALPVAEAVEALGIAGVQLKWPNDVLVAGRKVAGILCEAAAEGGRVRHAVVGIGVNVNVARFPSALRARADSLHRLRGRSVDRAGFVVDLCRRLETWMDRFEEHGAAPVLAAWKARGRFGAVTVELPEGTLRGVAEDLEPDGALRVRREDGSYAVIRTGEIVG